MNRRDEVFQHRSVAFGGSSSDIVLASEVFPSSQTTVGILKKMEKFFISRCFAPKRPTSRWRCYHCASETQPIEYRDCLRRHYFVSLDFHQRSRATSVSPTVLLVDVPSYSSYCRYNVWRHRAYTLWNYSTSSICSLLMSDECSILGDARIDVIHVIAGLLSTECFMITLVVIIFVYCLHIDCAIAVWIVTRSVSVLTVFQFLHVVYAVLAFTRARVSRRIIHITISSISE